MPDRQESGPAEPAPVLTRIHINEDGNLVVTDLWEEVRLFLEEGGMCSEN